MNRRLLSLAAISTLFVATAGAQISNGGFESGSFAPWTTTGLTAVTGTFSAQAPNEGSFQAALTTNASGTVNQASLESFLGLNSGTLNSLNGAGTTNRGGSAIAQTFTVANGAIIQFAWNFLPNGSNSSSSQNDSAFFTLHLSSASSSSFTLLDQSSNHPGSASGYSIFTTGPLAAGTYILGFGVYDVAGTGGPANVQDPALLIDRVSVVPEPATWSLIVIGLGVAAVAIRRRIA